MTASDAPGARRRPRSASDSSGFRVTDTLPPRRYRLLITVCFRERGVVAIPVERGGPVRRLDARAIVAELEALVANRNLAERVSVREACAGGCAGRGPNVGVTIYPLPPPGERADSIAIGWRTYVGSIGALDCLATIIDENLTEQTAPFPWRAPSDRRRSGR